MERTVAILEPRVGEAESDEVESEKMDDSARLSRAARVVYDC